MILMIKGTHQCGWRHCSVIIKTTTFKHGVFAFISATIPLYLIVFEDACLQRRHHSSHLPEDWNVLAHTQGLEAVLLPI